MKLRLPLFGALAILLSSGIAHAATLPASTDEARALAAGTATAAVSAAVIDQATTTDEARLAIRAALPTASSPVVLASVTSSDEARLAARDATTFSAPAAPAREGARMDMARGAKHDCGQSCHCRHG